MLKKSCTVLLKKLTWMILRQQLREYIGILIKLKTKND